MEPAAATLVRRRPDDSTTPAQAAMASSKTIPSETTPLSMMEALSSDTLYYQPPLLQPIDNCSSSPPRLILVFSWMDARDVYIAKYINQHRALYPTAAILLVRCRLEHFKSPKKALDEIQAAVPVIRAARCSSEEPELLVHAFSNGGSSMLAHLYDVYRMQADPDEDPRLPAHVTVFDSAPGYFRYWRSITAVSVGLAGWQKLLLLPVIHCYIIISLLLRVFTGVSDPMKTFGLAHNDRTKNATGRRRVYIYSEDDRLIDWRDVEDNARDARQKGFDVRLEKFHDSPHVAHSRTDGKRYWQIVRDIWEEGVDVELDE